MSLFLSLSLTPRHSSLGQGEASRHKALCVWGGMCPPTLHPEGTMSLLLSALCPPPYHLSTAHARLQLVTGSGQPPHTGAPGDFKQVPGTPAQFLVPHSSSPADPAPAMAPGAPSSSPSPVLAVLLFSLGKWNHPGLGAWDSGSPSNCLLYALHCSLQLKSEKEQENTLFREKMIVWRDV